MNLLNIKSERSIISILILILVASGTLMIWSSSRDSAIMDELAHIPAGYGYTKYLDARLNPEHPPLLKALSAVPLLFVKEIRFPVDHSSWGKDINGQWDAGTQFLYGTGNDADLIVGLSRIFPILLTLLTIIIIFVWSSELIGKKWALLPSFIFALSPNVLAHGHYVTTDIAATFGLVLASYFFFKALHRKSNKSVLLGGIAFGIAQLMKFSMALLIPYFIIMAVFFAAIESGRHWREESRPYKFLFYQIFRSIGKTISIFIIGSVVIYMAYALITLNYPQEKQISDSTAILSSFPNKSITDTLLMLEKNNFTRPISQYLLGLLMVIQRSSGGNTNYFLGHVSSTGSWYYFPLVYALKEPLPIIMIIITGLFLALKNIYGAVRKGWFYAKNSLLNYLGISFTEFGIFSFIAFYWLYSMKSPLNIGLRHILPTLPFVYILTASALRKWQERKIATVDSKSITPTLLKSKSLITILVFWLVIETGVSAPHFLSYFNELGGGTRNGYKFVTDSNYDWGQDLKALQGFVEEKNITSIAIDYFGGGSPKYYLGSKAESWSSSRGNPKDIGIEWLAVSVNTLQNAIQPTKNNFERNPKDEYSWLKEARQKEFGFGSLPSPDFKAGTSIFIYHL